MKEKRLGTNIMALIFVPGSLINERNATGTNIMTLMKEKQLGTKYYMIIIILPGFSGTNIMATIFVPGTIHHYLNLRHTRTNSMTIIFVPGSEEYRNASKATRNEYYGHYINFVQHFLK